MITNARADVVNDPKGVYESLVERFGKGWEAGDEGAMSEVFTETGAFLPTPFDTPVKGRDAIRAYWKNIPREQAEITFRWGEIFVVGPWFSTEFKCVFRRRRTGEWVEVRGALFCETEGPLLSEMRMYWQRSMAQR